MRKYKSKKIFISGNSDKYIFVRVYNTLEEMREGLRKFRPDEYHEKTLGANCPYKKIKSVKGKDVHSKEIATVFLNREYLGAGLVAHELGHAAIWGFKYNSKRPQYPKVVGSMNQEEKLLQSLTWLVSHFYDWAFKTKIIK